MLGVFQEFINKSRWSICLIFVFHVTSNGIIFTILLWQHMQYYVVTSIVLHTILLLLSHNITANKRSTDLPMNWPINRLTDRLIKRATDWLTHHRYCYHYQKKVQYWHYLYRNPTYTIHPCRNDIYLLIDAIITNVLCRRRWIVFRGNFYGYHQYYFIPLNTHSSLFNSDQWVYSNEKTNKILRVTQGQGQIGARGSLKASTHIG